MNTKDVPIREELFTDEMGARNDAGIMLGFCTIYTHRGSSYRQYTARLAEASKLKRRYGGVIYRDRFKSIDGEGAAA